MIVFKKMKTFMKQTALFLLVLPGIICLSSKEMSTQEENVFQKVANSCSFFANNFYKVLSGEFDGNIVTSPFSLYITLLLLNHGSKGLTLDELEAVLHLKDNNVSHKEIKSLMTVLNDLKDIELQIANAMYIQDGFQILSDFVTISKNYNCGLSKIDFKNKQQAIDEINLWVKNATRDKIPTILSTDDIDDAVRAILVNAVYFKGHWLHKFDEKLTQSKLFYMTKENKKFVPMMYKEAKYVYGEIPSLNAHFIEMPYLVKDIAMVILLPQELEGVQFLEQNFKWEDYLKASRREIKLHLYLPRFKYEVTINLKDILCKLGLRTMFENNADFGRLTNESVKIGKVLQKAFIEVNEEGSEAAAATVAQIRLRRAIIETVEEFLVNHPFLFIIYFKPGEIPLFLGSVKNIDVPTKKDEL